MLQVNDQIKLLVLQSSPFCNLGCSYCYLSEIERSDTRRMSDQTIRDSINFIKESNKVGSSLTILWHAGEPMALPVSYYRNAINIIKAELPNTSIRFNFQTNATTINQEWCGFIKENNISIGVSIDGPKKIHDQKRLTKNDKGTFDLTMRGVNLLKKNNIPFGTISVITTNSLSFPSEIIEFLLELNSVSIGFNIEENERHHTTSDLTKNKTKLKSFVQTVCNILHEKQKLDKCREYRETANSILKIGNFSKTRRTENKINGIISITWEGGVSTFSPELCGYQTEQYGDFIFGNVKDGFLNYSNNSKLEKINLDIESGIKKCENECQYFESCGGGSPSNKLQENSTFISTETIHCYFHNILFVEEFMRHAITKTHIS